MCVSNANRFQCVVCADAKYILVKEHAECKSKKVRLGLFVSSAQKCAKMCKRELGCEFFIVGKGTNTGSCYYEKTTDASCPEGWQASRLYDFMRLDLSTTRPTTNPTNTPTKKPSQNPTRKPTKNPTGSPTRTPTRSPTNKPSHYPTNLPTGQSA